MSVVSKWMYSNEGILGSDKYKFGDLYGLSYISKFRLLKNEQKLPPINPISNQQDVHLTAIGDSYMYSFFDEHVKNFERVKDYQFVTWEERNAIKLPKKSSEKKVLLIEIVERNAWGKLSIEQVEKCFQLNKHQKAYKEKPTVSLENNLEFLLFEHRLFSPIKELKTSILLNVNNQLSGDVKISKDGEQLYLKETMDSESYGNSFHPISLDSYHDFEERLNLLNTYCKKIGFDELWLVIAPNPVRVLQTEEKVPNKLFDYLSQSKSLQAKFVNILPALTPEAKFNFFASDTHWNQKGASVFRDQLNQELLKIGK